MKNKKTLSLRFRSQRKECKKSGLLYIKKCTRCSITHEFCGNNGYNCNKENCTKIIIRG